MDTQGEFSQWWQSNLDPEANVAAVKGMKVRQPLPSPLLYPPLPTSVALPFGTNLAPFVAIPLLRWSALD